MPEQTKGKIIDLIPHYRAGFPENGGQFSVGIQQRAVRARILEQLPTAEDRAAAIEKMRRKAPPRPLYFDRDPNNRK